MRRLVPLTVGTLVALSACSDQPSPPNLVGPAAPSPSPSPASERPDLLPSAADARRVQVFFSTDAMLCDGVGPVSRDVPAAAPLRPALEQLFAGPAAAEQAAGLTGLAVPGLLRGVRIADRRVYVDLVGDRFPGTATTSCGGAAFNATLTATVRGIVSDAQVVVALDGDPKQFVEAQQGFCDKPPTLGDRCDASGF